MQGENEIVFEDLHGITEEGETMEVDLDTELKDAGINRVPAANAVDDDAIDDDDIEIEDLRSAPKAEPKADEPDDAIKPSEDDDYSKKVKARIQRESRAKRKAQGEAEYWKGQAEKLSKDTYSRDRAELTAVVEQTNSELAALDDQLEAVIEAGNTKEQVRLTKRLTDLKAQNIQAEISLRDLPTDGEIPPFDGKVPPSSDKPASLAAQWKEDRGDWYGADGFERHTRMANLVDREVFADGYDPETPEYFKELDKRVKAKQPNLYEDLAADDPPPKNDKRPTRSPVAPVDSGANRQRSKGSNKVELTEADFANMRRFNLDTHDPEVLKEYARNKREGANQ